jgi:hypothetical protein
MPKRMVCIGLLLAACKATPTASAPTPDTIYAELVAAGCLAPVDGGAAVIAQEQATAPPDPWMTCLSEGGSVKSCNVPCDAAQ